MSEHAAFRIIPYLRVSDAEAAIRFYCEVFGAVERFRYPMPDGTIGFAELDVHGATVQLADADYADNTPLRGPAAITLCANVPAVDATYAAALAAGAGPAAEPADDPMAGRRAAFIDPFGHRWLIAERVSIG